MRVRNIAVVASLLVATAAGPAWAEDDLDYLDHQTAVEIGEAELRHGHYLAAAEHLAHALREAAGASDEDIERTRELFAEARRHVGTLALVVEPEGAEITVDARPLGTAPIEGERFVAPGRRVVEARCAGFATARAEVDAAAGATQVVRLRLTPLSAATPATPLRPDTASHRMGEPVYWPAVAAFGFAAAGFAMGLGFTMEAVERDRAADQILQGSASVTDREELVCPPGSGTPSCVHLDNLLEERRRYTKLAVAGYAAGGLAGAVGLALAVWPIRTGPSRGAAKIAPVASVEGGGLRISGSF